MKPLIISLLFSKALYKNFYMREKDYYSKNLSILNIPSYRDLNLFLDAKIYRTREIMTLLKL